LQTGENSTGTDGRGKWIVTTDLCADAVHEALAPVLPKPDTIRYRFGNSEVILQMQDGNPNKIAAAMR
jgi:hypothetical protein